MSILFWGVATIMSLAAMGFVAIPLRARKLTPRAPAAIAVLVLPASAFALYLLIGSPGELIAEAQTVHDKRDDAQMPSQNRTAGAVGTVASLVDGLSARLQREPDDGGGWLLLARSYDHLGRTDDAIAAYARARSLGKTDTAFEVSLLGDTTATAPVAQISGPSLRGRVELSPKAAAQIELGDTVFIFAKESSNDRMPVVALRKPASDLPFDFVLTDKDAMSPGTRLEDFEFLVVTARISRSGNAMDNSRSLEAWSRPVSPVDGKSVELLIIADSQVTDDSDE